ncbi:MAG: hypothetical protein HOV94_39145 [Saccharothrix sp.]|nr:hypothetical protein [Saccharothrix sp.]
MAIHSRVQLDPTAQLSVRPGRDGAVEILALDPHSDCSTVIELSPTQLDTLRRAAEVQARHEG